MSLTLKNKLEMLTLTQGLSSKKFSCLISHYFMMTWPVGWNNKLHTRHFNFLFFHTNAPLFLSDIHSMIQYIHIWIYVHCTESFLKYSDWCWYMGRLNVLQLLTRNGTYGAESTLIPSVIFSTTWPLDTHVQIKQAKLAVSKVKKAKMNSAVDRFTVDSLYCTSQQNYVTSGTE